MIINATIKETTTAPKKNKEPEFTKKKHYNLATVDTKKNNQLTNQNIFSIIHNSDDQNDLEDIEQVPETKKKAKIVNKDTGETLIEEKKELTEEEKIIAEEIAAKKREKRKKAKENKKIQDEKTKEEAQKKKEYDEGGFLDEMVVVSQESELFCQYKPAPNVKVCGLSLRWLNLRCLYCGYKWCTKHAVAEAHGCGEKAAIADNKAFKDKFYKPDNSIMEHERDYLKKLLKEKVQKAELGPKVAKGLLDEDGNPIKKKNNKKRK